MRYYFLLCIIAGNVSNSLSQVLENVKFALSGDRVVITYNLTSPDPTQKFKITVYSAHDNYISPVQHAEGDVGEGITSGIGKRIEWDAKRSLPQDFDGNINIKLKGVAMPNLKPLEYSVYKKGGEIKVTWTGGKPGDKMNIELLRDGKEQKIIGSGVDNTSPFNWKIPNSLKAGKNYTIRLSNISDPMQPSTTDGFQIKAKIPLIMKVLPVVAIGVVIWVITDKDKDKDKSLPSATLTP